jgi:menaquinone-dependent protoporphyrinogen IX oxidase
LLSFLPFVKGEIAMKKILIVHESRTGNTKQMADYIAEGVRMNGGAVDLKKTVLCQE